MSSGEAYGDSFASGDFWIDDNRLQMAINGIFKNVLMVKKKKLGKKDKGTKSGKNYGRAEYNQNTIYKCLKQLIKF